MKGKQNGTGIENHIAYIHGRIEAQIEGFAQALNIPPNVLAERLAQLLHPLGSGSYDRLSKLPKATTSRGAAMGKVEVASYARGRVQKAKGHQGHGLTEAGRRKLSQLMKARHAAAHKQGLNFNTGKPLKKAA